ncbi:uncharacterized protein LOC117318663 [Pecten maximus]|uniref:uncharacterized protein LOC117318663 n=1 Tax=Pecten maximus TaxID=6579 RepID=UPI00145856CA|nr:uncharacterized protein LOC117318663 [Pecten maximus]
MLSWEDFLRDIYYDLANAGSFSGPDKLYRYVRKDGKYVISKYKIRKLLQRKEPYSLQISFRRPFKRNTIIVTGIGDQWSADLMDMVKFKSENDDYAYVLIVIDVFSKYLWMRLLKDKKDKRVIKTIKSRLYRYFTHKRNYVYVTKLQTFAESYNQTYHRTIGMAPANVTKTNETSIWWRMYWPKKQSVIRKTKKIRKPVKFKVGDQVRLSHLRNLFSREYDEKWTGEIFTISQKILRGGLQVFRVKDYDGDEIKGTFYQSELQKKDVRTDDMSKVETDL